MSRLERKCLVASAGAHSALVLLLFLGPVLWVSKHQEVALPMLTFIPSRLVDGAMGGGGSPEAKSPPAPAPAAPRAVLAPPTPAPPPKAEPAPKQEDPPAKSRPRKSDPVPAETKMAKLDEADDSGQGKPVRRKIEISLKRESGSSRENSAAEARAHAESAARAAQGQYAAKVNSILGAIGQGVSSGTSIDVPGPGGAAYADYGQWVVAVYYQAWAPPNDLSDDSATVTVSVVILRNGSVESGSFKVLRRSGHPALDRSVERLRSVTYIARFPDGAQDEKRTFIIEFKPRLKT